MNLSVMLLLSLFSFLSLFSQRCQGKISFFMYSGLAWDELITDCVPATQYSAELYGYRQLLGHPYRVKDPEHALIFVIPLFLGSAARGRCKLSADVISSKAIDLLTNSTYFLRHIGSDHLVFNEDFRSVVSPELKPLLALLRNTMRANIEDGLSKTIARCNFCVPYGTDPNSLVALNTDSDAFWKRRYNTFFIGQIDPRPAYNSRREALRDSEFIAPPSVFMVTTNAKVNNLTECNISSGTVVKCHNANWKLFNPLLRASRANLVFSGDGLTAIRLFDGLQQESLPFVFHYHSYFKTGLPFQCLVPWHEIVLGVDEKLFATSPSAAINSAYQSMDQPFATRALALLRHYFDDVIWVTNSSRVAENSLVEAAKKCIPRSLIRQKVLNYARYIMWGNVSDLRSVDHKGQSNFNCNFENKLYEHFRYLRLEVPKKNGDQSSVTTMDILLQSLLFAALHTNQSLWTAYSSGLFCYDRDIQSEYPLWNRKRNVVKQRIECFATTTKSCNLGLSTCQPVTRERFHADMVSLLVHQQQYNIHSLLSHCSREKADLTAVMGTFEKLSSNANVPEIMKSSSELFFGWYDEVVSMTPCQQNISTAEV